MSENKKDRNLPDKDYFRTYKGDKEKRKHLEVSDEEKMEFAAAFSDDEASDAVKAYTPGKKVTAEAQQPVPEAPSVQSEEEMYTLPEFNSDEFFASLGFGAKEKQASAPAKKASPVKNEAAAVEEGKTVDFTKTQAVRITENKPAEPKKREAPAETLSGTRHFNLRSKTKKIQLEKGRKNSGFKQNFRVLSKDKEDRAIIESAPVGKGGKGLADSVRARKGENIFDAVEKAYLNKDEVTQIKIENSALRKERETKGLIRAEEIRREAEKDINKQKNYLIVYGVLFALSLIFTLFFNYIHFYGTFSLVVSAILVLMNIPDFIKSFKALRKLSAIPETALLIMSFFVVIHNIVMLSLHQVGSIYTICVIFACFMQSFSTFFRQRNKLRLLSMATKSKRLSILQRIPVKNETAAFTASVEAGEEPDIFYCAKAYLDTSVEEPEFDSTSENKYYIFSMSVVLLASLVVGLLCFASQLRGISFISGVTATICALLPVMYDPINRYVFYHKGTEMFRHGACISGREALRHIGSSDGFVLDAKDVFAGEIARFRKSAITRIDQNMSAVFTAAMMYEADSVLAPCFDSFIEQMGIALPEVENFQYEERLGYAAWINDRKVLIGNRQMLLNHSITVPSKEHEKAYGKGRFVMYVVIDGEISATFLVNYKVLSSLRKYSRDFNKTGLILMFNSREAFLNEEIVASKLSLDISSVKVLSSKATAVMEKYNNSIEEQEPTGLLCSLKKKSIMHLIMGCYNLNALNKRVFSMMLIGQLLGIALLIASPILKMNVFINPVTIVILRLLWCGIVTLTTEQKKQA